MKTLHSVRKLLQLRRAELESEELTIAQLRTMEAKDILDLTLEEITLYANAINIPVNDLMINVVGIIDWPTNRIRFWEIIYTTYKPSAKKTHDMLSELFKGEKIPSYPTLYRWLHSPDKGYNKIPIKYLLRVYRKRAGL